MENGNTPTVWKPSSQTLKVFILIPKTGMRMTSFVLARLRKGGPTRGRTHSFTIRWIPRAAKQLMESTERKNGRHRSKLCGQHWQRWFGVPHGTAAQGNAAHT